MPFGCCFPKKEDVAFRGLPPRAAQEKLLETDEVLNLVNVANQSVYDELRYGKSTIDPQKLRVACVALRNLFVTLVNVANQSVYDELRYGKSTIDPQELRVACVALRNLFVTQNVLDTKVRRESYRDSLASSSSMRPGTPWA